MKQNFETGNYVTKCEKCLKRTITYIYNIITGHHCSVLGEDCKKGGDYFINGESEAHSHWICRECKGKAKRNDNRRAKRIMNKEKLEKQQKEKLAEEKFRMEWNVIGKYGMENVRKMFNQNTNEMKRFNENYTTYYDVWGNKLEKKDLKRRNWCEYCSTKEKALVTTNCNIVGWESKRTKRMVIMIVCTGCSGKVYELYEEEINETFERIERRK